MSKNSQKKTPCFTEVFNILREREKLLNLNILTVFRKKAMNEAFCLIHKSLIQELPFVL